MNPSETQPADSAAAENLVDASIDSKSRRISILILLGIVLIAHEMLKDVLFSFNLREWRPAWLLIFYGMIGLLPFLLRKMAPRLAGFDIQWLPTLRRQWAWFLVMLFLMVFVAASAVVVYGVFIGRAFHMPYIAPTTPLGVISYGIAIVLVGPIAEEIFFRCYVLDQLRKFLPSWIALVIQAFLFGFYHLYTRGMFTSLAIFVFATTFFYGIILGFWRIKFKSIVPLMLVHIFINASALIALKSHYDVAVNKVSLSPCTISKETTRITEPLRKDGRVDYVAALDRRFREGVTPENNAAVLMWKAVGPAEISKARREEYFRRLGMTPLAEEGEYFVDRQDYVPRQKKESETDTAKSDSETELSISAQMDLATKRPWTQQEFPILAEWLTANEKPLALAIEASKRPRRYDPLLGSSVICILLPDVYHHRNIAFALRARAMLRLGEGKIHEAWDDLLACHRLARLVGQGPTLTEAVAALSIEREACAGDQAIRQHVHLNADQVAMMRADLDRLPAMPNMAGKMDANERFVCLDAVSEYAHARCASLAGFAAVGDLDLGNKDEVNLNEAIQSLIRHGARATIDSDMVLRRANAWYDQIVDACRKPQGAERRMAFQRLGKDLQELYKRTTDTKSFDKAMLGNPREALSEQFSNVLLTLLLPKINHIQYEDRWLMRFELDKLGFALAAYRADHGRYPPKLDDLAPRYVAAVPKDPFSDAPLHYQPEAQGYLLYSVGVNGRDDGAKGYEDYESGKDYDDLVIRVPAPEPKQTGR